MGASRPIWTIVLVAVVAVVGIVAAAPGAGAPADAGDSLFQTDDDGASATAPLGQHVSSFMQASAAEAGESVDAGLWSARAAEPDDVERRANGLDQRAQRIQAQLEDLDAAYEADEIDEMPYRVRRARLVGQYMGLAHGLERAETTVEERGVETPPGLERARERVDRVGEEVRRQPPGLPGGEPPGLSDGEDHPGQGEGPPDDDREPGPPDDDHPGQGGGPPEDDSPGNDRGEGSNSGGSDGGGGNSGGGGPP